MTDAEITEMRDQIAKELDTDPMDGGIAIPDASDGITRYPQDGNAGAIGADDVIKYDGEVPPGQKDDIAKAKEIEKDHEDDEDEQEVDSEFIVKKGKKK